MNAEGKGEGGEVITQIVSQRFARCYYAGFVIVW